MAFISLDKTAAIEADSLGGIIVESGKYIGKYIRAERLVSQRTGAEGVGLTFESDGKTCRLDLWIRNHDGTQKYSDWKIINAIMTCLGLKELFTQQGQVERWNPETRQRESVKAEIIPALLDKPIGMVLQKTEYRKFKDGYETDETGWQAKAVTAFRAADEFTASEIMKRATAPLRLPEIIANLKDRPLTDKPRSAPAAQATSTAAPPAANSGSGFDDIDDDIPF